MMHKQRIWDIKECNKEKASCFAAELGISPLVTGILLERGVDSIDAMRDSLYGSAQPFHDPFLLKDMQRSVSVLRERWRQERSLRFMAITMWTA